MFDPVAKPLIFERSISRTTGLLVLSIFLTGVPCFFFTHGMLRFANEAWLLGMILGPVAIVINLFSLFRGGPQIIFDEHGIRDLRTSWGLFRWDELNSIEIVTIYASRFLSLKLVDESSRIAQLSTWGRLALLADYAKGVPAFKIRFLGLNPGMPEALKYLETYHSEKMIVMSPTAAHPS